MDLRPYIESIHHQLLVAAQAGGDDARALAERLVAPLDTAVRLTLQDVLATAAEEITVELAPGSVELRLRGRDPEFVVTAPPAPALPEGDERANDERPGPVAAGTVPPAGDEGATARINLRLPPHLKAGIEQAAEREGLSINSWLVRAASAVLERTDVARPRERRAAHGAQRYTGWAH